MIKKFITSISKTQANFIKFNFANHNLQFTPENAEFFQKNGYLHLDSVVDHQQLDQVREYTKSMVEQWDILNKKKVVFESGKAMRGVDFLETGDKIHYFFENDAFDSKDNAKYDEHQIINKIGHAQHDLDPFFEKFCYQQVFKDILQGIGYQAPQLVQSMYIFKNPKIGGEVVPHTDNTYLITQPRLSCVGVWIALNDATLENGCLWGIPRSQENETNYFMNRSDDNANTHYLGEEEKYDLSKAVPIEAKKGSIVILSGDFVHFSYHNKSKLPRHAFTLHFTEGPEAGVQWHEKNWMQRPNLPFRNYYNTVSNLQ